MRPVAAPGWAPTALLALAFTAAATWAAPDAVAQQAEFRAALGMLGQGNPEGATQALEALTEAYPTFVPAWNTLGRTHMQAGRHAEALAAYEKAHALAATPASELNVGAALAMTGRMDAAYEHILAAAGSGQVDITALAQGPAANALQKDPRWADVWPSDDAFAYPFAEKGVTVIRDWHGEGQGDVFGWIARNIGDVDGDGVDDVTTSSHGLVETGSQSGKVYTYSSGTGALLWTATGSVAGGRLGMGIESAGDVNADGTPDVVAGAPYAGYVEVYSGLDGSVLHRWTSDDATSGFGASVRGVGDMDGDGHGDILVGAPMQIFGGPVNGGDTGRAGEVRLYSGASGRVLLTLRGEPGEAFGANVHGSTVQMHRADGSIDVKTWLMVGAPGAEGGGVVHIYTPSQPAPIFTLSAGTEGAAQFGAMFMSVVGDVDADGYPDFYVADWGDNAAAQGAGRIHVFSGRDGEKLFDRVGEAAGDGFGIGIADAGDVNRDGHDDLIVGAWQHASEAASGGKLYVISGRDERLLRTITGNVPGETLGFDATNVGDVDGDGTPDFLVTSAYSAVNGYRSGRVMIISGR